MAVREVTKDGYSFKSLIFRPIWELQKPPLESATVWGLNFELIRIALLGWDLWISSLEVQKRARCMCCLPRLLSRPLWRLRLGNFRLGISLSFVERQHQKQWTAAAETELQFLSSLLSPGFHSPSPLLFKFTKLEKLYASMAEMRAFCVC